MPDGVASVIVEIWGGGGSGAGSNNNVATGGGGGGGGGAYTRAYGNVTKGASITFNIGGGGANVSGNTNGNPGGTTDWNNSQFVGNGGGPGNWSGNASTPGQGGAGGAASVVTAPSVSFAGGAGAAQNGGNAGGGGGGSAGGGGVGGSASGSTGGAAGGIGPMGFSQGAIGGAGGTRNLNGQNGTAIPGAGGGGGGRANTTTGTNRVGANGTNGQIIIYWGQAAAPMYTPEFEQLDDPPPAWMLNAMTGSWQSYIIEDDTFNTWFDTSTMLFKDEINYEPPPQQRTFYIPEIESDVDQLFPIPIGGTGGIQMGDFKGFWSLRAGMGSEFEIIQFNPAVVVHTISFDEQDMQPNQFTSYPFTEQEDELVNFRPPFVAAILPWDTEDHFSYRASSLQQDDDIQFTPAEWQLPLDETIYEHSLKNYSFFAEQPDDISFKTAWQLPADEVLYDQPVQIPVPYPYSDEDIQYKTAWQMPMDETIYEHSIEWALPTPFSDEDMYVRASEWQIPSDEQDLQPAQGIFPVVDDQYEFNLKQSFADADEQTVIQVRPTVAEDDVWGFNTPVVTVINAFTPDEMGPTQPYPVPQQDDDFQLNPPEWSNPFDEADSLPQFRIINYNDDEWGYNPSMAQQPLDEAYGPASYCYTSYNDDEWSYLPAEAQQPLDEMYGPASYRYTSYNDDEWSYVPAAAQQPLDEAFGPASFTYLSYNDDDVAFNLQFSIPADEDAQFTTAWRAQQEDEIFGFQAAVVVVYQPWDGEDNPAISTKFAIDIDDSFGFDLPVITVDELNAVQLYPVIQQDDDIQWNASSWQQPLDEAYSLPFPSEMNYNDEEWGYNLQFSVQDIEADQIPTIPTYQQETDQDTSVAAFYVLELISDCDEQTNWQKFGLDIDEQFSFDLPFSIDVDQQPLYFQPVTDDVETFGWEPPVIATARDEVLYENIPQQLTIQPEIEDELVTWGFNTALPSMSWSEAYYENVAQQLSIVPEIETEQFDWGFNPPLLHTDQDEAPFDPSFKLQSFYVPDIEADDSAYNFRFAFDDNQDQVPAFPLIDDQYEFEWLNANGMYDYLQEVYIQQVRVQEDELFEIKTPFVDVDEQTLAPVNIVTADDEPFGFQTPAVVVINAFTPDEISLFQPFPIPQQDDDVQYNPSIWSNPLDEAISLANFQITNYNDDEVGQATFFAREQFGEVQEYGPAFQLQWPLIDDQYEFNLKTPYADADEQFYIYPQLVTPEDEAWAFQPPLPPMAFDDEPNFGVTPIMFDDVETFGWQTPPLVLAYPTDADQQLLQQWQFSEYEDFDILPIFIPPITGPFAPIVHFISVSLSVQVSEITAAPTTFIYDITATAKMGIASITAGQFIPGGF